MSSPSSESVVVEDGVFGPFSLNDVANDTIGRMRSAKGREEGTVAGAGAEAGVNVGINDAADVDDEPGEKESPNARDVEELLPALGRVADDKASPNPFAAILEVAATADELTGAPDLPGRPRRMGAIVSASRLFDKGAPSDSRAISDE